MPQAASTTLAYQAVQVLVPVAAALLACDAGCGAWSGWHRWRLAPAGVLELGLPP
jgi:hypothetical protein